MDGGEVNTDTGYTPLERLCVCVHVCVVKREGEGEGEGKKRVLQALLEEKFQHLQQNMVTSNDIQKNTNTPAPKALTGFKIYTMLRVNSPTHAQRALTRQGSNNF